MMTGNGKDDISLMSPLTFSFIGDTVFDILVRKKVISAGNRPIGELHALAAEKVCAPAQARAAEVITPLLTEEESDIFRRGRNAHTTNVPRHASRADYHSATGLECLFGWLYLKGEEERIRALFSVISDSWENENEE